MWMVKKIALLKNGDKVTCSELLADDFDQAYKYIKRISPSIALKDENIGFSAEYEGLFGAGSLSDADMCIYKYHIYELKTVESMTHED